ncbi:SusD/RagB family nutrient-binding outer membrane lipoprotein [Mucilaginibacter gynuensis]|uniref:SusD/RagB family nutrient-binding outer membrane lipoprotein n=1 Tax=Mucilaginibacter gynuensis TaxID=1302236 RepID=A0ABP8GHH8_9SPHI
MDVNQTNPNNPVAVGVDLVLPQALAATASTSVTFNSYGAWTGGFQANAGGFGGFGAVLTYNYTTSDNTGLWSQSYNNINDFQYVINNSAPTGIYKNFNAVAKIMRVFAFQRLVDVYGDVPYTESAKGLENLTPKYDKAEDIYKDLIKQIDDAIVSINLPNDKKTTVSLARGTNGSIDITGLSGDGYTLTGWKKFANTLKLRLLIRIQKVGSLASTYNAGKASLASLGAADFLTDDVLVQPGYAKQDGKQNPAFQTYAYDAAGNATQSSNVPTWYARAFYAGDVLEDNYRYGATYRTGTNFNQLGYTGSDAATSPTGSNWYIPQTDESTIVGILKGPNAPFPLMLAAEGYFLQAEANLIGLLSGGTSAVNLAFHNGIGQSIKYLYKNASGTPTETDGDIFGAGGYVDSYAADNASRTDGNGYLADITSATSDEERLEAIITQKWIALNFITSNEAWAEFRRTGFPKSNPTADGNDVSSIVSLQSTSPRADKLPVRVLYPQSEYAVNAGNAPTGVSQFTSRIFWDAN